MAMLEEFRKARYSAHADSSLGEYDEPFYLYLAGEVESRGVDAIEEIERCVLETDGSWKSVYLAMVLCGDDEDENNVARRLSAVLRVLREHPDATARMSAVAALLKMRPDMLDEIYAHETNSHVKYCISRHVIEAELRGLVGRDVNLVRESKRLLELLHHWRDPAGKSSSCQNMRNGRLTTAVKIFGAARAAVLVNFILGHRFMTDETRRIALRIIHDCAPPELLAMFRALDAQA